MKTKSRRQHGVMAILLAMALLACLFGAAPAAGQVHLYNPEVWPDSGIAGEEIFRITADYMDEICPWPIENFEDNVPNDEQTDLAIQLTNHPASDTHPCWSPCNTISFASNRIAYDLDIVDSNGWRHSDIWVMDPDGTDKGNVTYNDARDGYDVSWSPDCALIVFCRTDASWTSLDDEICTVDPSVGETSVRFRYRAGDTQCPDWASAAINKVAFSMAPTWQTFTIDASTWSAASVTQVTSFPNDCQWPDWHPSDNKIAFEHFTAPTHEIWVVDLTVATLPVAPNAAGTTMLTSEGILPAWSPDGSKIAFCRDTLGNRDIWVKDLNTGAETRMTKDPATDLHPTWSPDGSKIAFQSDRSGNWDIWVIPVTPNDMHPRLAVDSDGDVHKVWMREIEPEHWEIWYAELDGPGPNFKVSPKQISDACEAYNSVYPSIALDSADDSHVVWVDFRNNNIAEIYYSKIEDATGTDLTNAASPFTDVRISALGSRHSGRAVGFLPVGGSIVDGRIAEYIEHPDIVVDLLGLVHIVWSDERGNPGVWEVYYQRQTNVARPTGANVLNNDLLITGLADNINSMCPVIDFGLGAIHIAWQDERDGCWEIYYKQLNPANPSGPPNVGTTLVSHVIVSDGYNSASPDIGVDTLYIHITWMDQRDYWYEDDGGWDCVGASCCNVVSHIWDAPNSQYQWEIYKVMLWSSGDFFTWQGNPIKRHSDMTTCRGCGRYTGPASQTSNPTPINGPDGYSMYPRIAVEPVFSDDSLTHVTWHDDRDGYWEIYYTELQSYCENPEGDKRVTFSGNDFWAVWPPTHDPSAEIIVLTSAPSGATVTISNPYIQPTQTGTAFPSSPYICVLDTWASDLMSTCDGGVMDNAIHVTATAPVTVLFRTHSGLGDVADDIYLVLPTTLLGSEYYSLTYDYSGGCSWYVVIATKDNTEVEYASCPGLITTTTLNQGETLTVTCPPSPITDITGRHVSTDISTPLGFVAGSKLSLIPPGSYAADTLMAMLLPVELWGCDYYTAPLEPIPPTGDIIGIQASEDDTDVIINSGVPQRHNRKSQ